jgi:hypothetical protein
VVTPFDLDFGTKDVYAVDKATNKRFKVGTKNEERVWLWPTVLAKGETQTHVTIVKREDYDAKYTEE